MRPRERQETGEQDLFRSRLDRIIDLTHALVKLSRAIDWRFLEMQFGSVYSDGPGCPPLPTRLMAGLALLLVHEWKRPQGIVLCILQRRRTDILAASVHRQPGA